jgi:hypothetical protein
MEGNCETTSRIATPNQNLIGQGERIYFDTNVFDPTTGISDAQLAVIRDSCRGTLRLVFGVECFEEALLNLDSSESNKAFEHLRRIVQWSDDRLIAKPVDELICDDIIAYSNGRVSSPWLENPRLAIVRKGLGDVRRLDLQGLKREFASDIDELRRRRAHYVTTFEQTVCELSSDQFILDNRRSNCPDFYRITAPTVARNFARMTERYRNESGVFSRCEARGIEGLLNILSVQLASIVTISLMHSQLLNEGRQKAKPRGGDLGDMRHAAAASSSADVFVTNDERLYKRLSSVPVNSWRVIWLKSLVEKQDSREKV